MSFVLDNSPRQIEAHNEKKKNIINASVCGVVSEQLNSKRGMRYIHETHFQKIYFNLLNEQKRIQYGIKIS